MDVKRFRKQIKELTQIMGRTIPKKFHLVIGHSTTIPMGTRIYLTDEDPKLVAEGKGRTDHRYITVEGNFQNDTLSIALRQDLTGTPDESAVLGNFAGPVQDKLNQAALISLSWMVNGDKPALTH